VAPCKSCVNRYFGGTYRLHLQDRQIREKRGTSVCCHLLTLVDRCENLNSFISMFQTKRHLVLYSAYRGPQSELRRYEEMLNSATVPQSSSSMDVSARRGWPACPCNSGKSGTRRFIVITRPVCCDERFQNMFLVEIVSQILPPPPVFMWCAMFGF
jgi:hypothetical protein